MKTNDCFTDESLTLSMDIETNQWYNAEGVLNWTGIVNEPQNSAACNAYITTVIDFMKAIPTTAYNNAPCFSMRDIKTAVDKANEIHAMFGYEKARPWHELACMDFLFGNLLKSEACEVNLAGMYVLRTENWLDKDIPDLKQYLGQLPIFHNTALDEGYHAITTQQEIDEMLERFINFHFAGDKGIGLIVAHNMSYEWNNCMRNSKTIASCVSAGWMPSPMRGNAANTLKALDITIPNAEETQWYHVVDIRDTFMYARQSLRKAGDKFGYEKGELDYMMAFDANEIANAVDAKVRGDVHPNPDYDNMVNYNRRDTEIPFLILHDSFCPDYATVLAKTSKKGTASVPVSNNQIAGKRDWKASENVYEVTDGWMDNNGNHYSDTDRRPYGCHRKKVIERRTSAPTYANQSGKMVKIKSITADFLNMNKYIFSYDLKPHAYGTEAWTYSEEIQDDCKKVAGGGFVGINPLAAFHKFSKEGDDVKSYLIADDSFKEDETFRNYDICHCDLTSAHPSQVNKRYFPASAPTKVDQTTADDVMNQIICQLDVKAFKIVSNPTLPFSTVLKIQKQVGGTKNYSGFATFTLGNVRIKNVNGNVVPCIPASTRKSKISGKIDEETMLGMFRDAVNNTNNATNIESMMATTFIHRNKVFKAEAIDVTCTFEDLFIYKMFYDFDIVAVRDMYLYKMAVCPAYVWYCFDRWGGFKQTYKNLEGVCKAFATKKCTAQDVYDAFNTMRSIIFSSDYDYVRDHFFGCLDESNAKELVSYMHARLQYVKGIFNGIYGQNYQSQVHETIALGIVDGVVGETEVSLSFQPNMKRNYMVGMYIAQWSRIDIALHIKYCIDNLCKVFYWATDSIFYAAPQGFDIRNKFNAAERILQDQRPNNNLLGGMDMEQWDKENDASMITGFCTSQSLRNIVEYKFFDKADGTWKRDTEITFSGANDKAVFQGLRTFDEYCLRLCAENFVLSPFDNNKNSKKANSDGTYCLLPQGFVMNQSGKYEVEMARLIASAICN